MYSNCQNCIDYSDFHIFLSPVINDSLNGLFSIQIYIGILYEWSIIPFAVKIFIEAKQKKKNNLIGPTRTEYILKWFVSFAMCVKIIIFTYNIIVNSKIEYVSQLQMYIVVEFIYWSKSPWNDSINELHRTVYIFII